LKRVTNFLLVSVVVVIGPLGCRKPPALCEAPPAGAAKGARTSAEREAAARSAKGSWVVIDNSGSLAGFVRPGGTVISSLLTDLENSLVAAGVAEPPDRCLVGASVDCTRPKDRSELDKATLFRAPTSRLDLALRTPASPPPLSAEERLGGKVLPAPPTDQVASHKVTVLLTDGMESSKGPAAPGADPCLSGADPACFGRVLEERVAAGYAISVVLAYLPFKGLHFAERPIDDVQFRQTVDHLVATAKESRWQGAAFRLLSPKPGQPLRKPIEAFKYEGPKPLMFFVLGHDAALVDRVVAQFTGALRRSGRLLPRDAVFASKLAPLAPGGAQLASAARAGRRDDKVAVGTVRRRGGALVSLVRCQIGGVLDLKVKTESKPAAGLPEGVSERTDLVSASTGLPDGVAGAPVSKGSETSLEIQCARLRPGRHVVDYRLEQRLDIDRGAQAWWKEFSADDSYQAPERMYGLATLVSNVIQATGSGSHAADRLRLCVDRE